MQFSNLLLLLFASTAVLAMPEANPEAAKATKRTTRTRTDRKTNKDPPRPTGCNDGPFTQADCTANRARLGCTCYEMDLLTGDIYFGTCVSAEVSQIL